MADQDGYIRRMMSSQSKQPGSTWQHRSGLVFPAGAEHPTVVLGLDAPVARGVVVRLDRDHPGALVVDPETVRSFWLRPPAGHDLPKSIVPGSRGLFRLRRGRPEFEPAARPRRMPPAETTGSIRANNTRHAIKQEIAA